MFCARYSVSYIGSACGKRELGIIIELFWWFCQHGNYFVAMCLVRPLLISLQTGNYYLRHGGTTGECPYTSCSDADFGERYIPKFATSKDECEAEACANSPAPAGFMFATAGFCNLTRCTNAQRGTFYTQQCDVGMCTNGNARCSLTHTPVNMQSFTDLSSTCTTLYSAFNSFTST